MKQIAILLTDGGYSNINFEFTIADALAAANDGIEMFVIGK